MVDQWESVVYDTVKTPLEVMAYLLWYHSFIICSPILEKKMIPLQVYEELQRQGYLVDYERVPITDEKAPKEGDFDNLVSFTF